MHACTYLASVGDISKIVCYHQVLFAVVTKLQQFEEKATNIFAGSEFQKTPGTIYLAWAQSTIRYWKITRMYGVFKV